MVQIKERLRRSYRWGTRKLTELVADEHGATLAEHALLGAGGAAAACFAARQLGASLKAQLAPLLAALR